ncbi:hypothetical protein [Frigoriglobus tundricola]|uniref:Uncharacterized protein n=1 Tax=Frigoriglobus tundricola TaxID=2774151 RepID=A0A6M5YNQ2_9BACT|nr:hypothetical protein [Frigoriglobus tundricola]QJW95000.1 hypothetical protein FTUN_2526 [Frigoriglobus tundricola]
MQVHGGFHDVDVLAAARSAAVPARFLAAFAQLKEHAGSNIGYITFESPPPATAAAFRQAAAAND